MKINWLRTAVTFAVIIAGSVVIGLLQLGELGEVISFVWGVVAMGFAATKLGLIEYE